MKQLTKKRLLLFCLAGVLIYTSLYFFILLQVSGEEKQFLTQIQQRAEQSTQPFYLKDVTDFSWEKVCLVQIWEIEKHMIPERLERAEVEKKLDINLTHYDKKIPILERSPSNWLPPYRLVLLFVDSNKEIIKSMNFHRPVVNVHGKNNYLVNWDNSVTCMNKNAARLNQQANGSTILITDQ